METLEFLGAVLPSSGFYCAAEFSSKRKEHVFTPEISALGPTIQKFHQAQYDTYFALASFTNAGSRTAENAAWIKAAFLDIEGGEGAYYKTKADAAAALIKFLEDTHLDKLGSPWVVSSGGGLHVYWPFTEDIQIGAWKPVAENLKRLCKKHDLRIDFTVTADAARVLRVPGTTNWKKKYGKPRPVTIKAVGDKFDFATFAEVVKDKINGEAQHEDEILGERLPPSPNQIKLIENSTTSFKAILSAGCLQLVHYIEHAAEDGMEPLWRAMLSIAKPCIDGERAAKKLSALHPYAPARMHQKLRGIKGPYPCRKIDSENPGVCPACKYWGKITNPLALGREIVTEVVPKEITAGAAQIMMPTPPVGFSYGKNGGIFKDKVLEDEGDDGDPNTKTTHRMVLPYNLFPINILNLTGEHTAHLTVVRPQGTTNIMLPLKATGSKDETIRALASQNIIAAYGSGNDRNLYDYVRGCIEKMSTEKTVINVPPSYGWQDDNSFVYNGRVYTKQGIMSMPMPGLENLHSATVSHGTLEGWRDAIRMLIKKQFYEILSMSLVGFGSPLMRFTGLAGVTFHLSSTRSGTGKTMALDMAASIWGNPRDYRVSKSTSEVAMEQRLGLLRSLPLITDEITSKNNNDFEWFPQFLMNISNGRGKERMESSVNKERINLSTWCAFALMSSNTHAVDYLTGARGRSSHGELQRLLEKEMPHVIVMDAAENAELMKRNDNYGKAGERYAEWLVHNMELAKDVTIKTIETLRVQFNMSSEERYWLAGVGCCVAGGILAGKNYADIVDYPMEPIIEQFKKLVMHMRRSVAASVKTADDILNTYIRERFAKFVVVRMLGSKEVLNNPVGERTGVGESVTKSEVAGRVELDAVPNHTVMYIEEIQLKTHCSHLNFGYADFKAQMEQLYKVSYVANKSMLANIKGPVMRCNVMKIVRPTTFDDEVFNTIEPASKQA